MDDQDGFNDFLENAFRECEGSSAVSMSKDRSYDGQAHTDSGKRGQTLVAGLTMRDIIDCYIRALVLASDYRIDANLDLQRKLKEGSLIWDNVYELEGDNDPIAVAQNMTCEIERMMGIFPNIDKSLLTIGENNE